MIYKIHFKYEVVSKRELWIYGILDLNPSNN